tara:strand:- start:4683 stop:5000 length:318 start_codon:yes stop_codon:yes gene_type:complete
MPLKKCVPYNSELVQLKSPAVRDDFFSIRISNRDTFRFEGSGKTDLFYPILDNSFSMKEGINKHIDFVEILGNQIRKTPQTFSSDGSDIIKKMIWKLSIFEKRVF